MKRYEFFNHTADIGMRIFGRSQAELFENAGHALFSVITDVSKVQEKEKRLCKVVRDSVDELLVEWLNGLLYCHATELLLFKKFKIIEIDENHLLAEARGEVFRDGIHSIKTEVKAVTYHNLSVRRRRTGLWQATVVIDI